MQSNLKCAVYACVSTDNQAEVEYNSCVAQKEKIKSFIDSQKNMSIYKVYSDPSFTGANLNRSALTKLLNDIRKEKISLAIAYKIDHLTRSPKDFCQLIELFDKYAKVTPAVTLGI
jgi:site-specific DNA recombinase